MPVVRYLVSARYTFPIFYFSSSISPFERAQKLARIVQIAASSQFVEKTENIESLSAANRIFSDILRHTYAQRVFYFQFLFGECECLAFEN